MPTCRVDSSGCSRGPRSRCSLGFTVAAYNLDRVRSFRAKQSEEEGKPRRRAKRRQGTWRDCSDGPMSPFRPMPQGHPIS
jgi:hypothetical protein